MALLARRGLRALIRTTAAEDNPPAGQRLLVPHADGWYDRDSTGTETRLGSGGGSSAVPTQILDTETYAIADRTQALFTLDIDVLGTVDLAGTLVEV